MQNLQRRIDLDGEVYSITLLNARDARDSFADIAPLFIPLAGIYADEVANKEAGFESSIFTSLSASIASALSLPEVRIASDMLLHKVYKGSQQIDVDVEFAGRFSSYMKLITFAFKENYLDFFSELLASMGIEITSILELKDLLVEISKKSEEEQSESVESQKETSSS